MRQEEFNNAKNHYIRLGRYGPIARVEWKYLEGMLASKVDNEIADRVKLAHLKLPTLFRTIKTDKKIVYPFQYDYNTGVFKYPDLESKLRKNLSQGNGKARATGFAIPVLGRIPNFLLIHTSSNASSKWHCVY